MNVSLSKSFTIAFGAAKQTIYQASRSISQHSWKGKPAYKTGSPQQQKCIDHAFNAAADLGFDDYGAARGEIAGTGFHNHNSGGQGAKWITVQYYDDKGRVLWHKKKDGTEWNRIHLFEDLEGNKVEKEKPVSIYVKEE